MAVKKQFNSFQDLIANADRPVLVDFYANWCGPCHLLASILEQVQDQFSDRLQIVKIDTEKYPNLASEHHVYALPTLVLFKQGKPIDRIEGVLQPNQLIQRLAALV
ncbi:MAG: thioredoxin [Leptolyngbyaceae cyanobacterium]